MEMTDFTNSFGFAGLDFSVMVDKIYYFIGLSLLLIVIGGAFTLIYYLRIKGKNKIGSKKIGWWAEVGERLEPEHVENVEEIVIPGTLLKVFYGKKRNIWLPRFNRGVSKDLFYVAKTKEGQMVNFELTNLREDLKKAKLDFDHTDMLFSAENMREFIKKNYEDPSQKWWQLYKDTITTAVFILVMTMSLVIIIFFLRGVVEDIGAVSSQLGSILEQSCVAAKGSGIVPA